MNRPAFFAFYPADFAGDINVEAMSPLQVGAYILLLCKAWQADPPASLPNDDAVLARLARLTPDEWSGVKAGVLAPFALGADNRWHQKRLRQEYSTAITLMKERAKAGKAGASARWQTHGKRMAEPLPEQCDGNAIQIQNQSLPKEDKDPPTPPKGKGSDPIADIPIPPEIDTPEFAEAWRDWQAFRREKKSPLTLTGAKRQLKKLAQEGSVSACDRIGRSITNGWQGLWYGDERSSHGHATGTRGRFAGGSPNPHRVAGRVYDDDPAGPGVSESAQTNLPPGGPPHPAGEGPKPGTGGPGGPGVAADAADEF